MSLYCSVYSSYNTCTTAISEVFLSSHFGPSAVKPLVIVEGLHHFSETIVRVVIGVPTRGRKRKKEIGKT